MNRVVAARLLPLVLAAVAAGACEAQKSQNPLSPTVAGPIPGVVISAPTAVSPSDGEWVVNTQPLRLVFNNSTSNGVRPFWYVVELAADNAFQQKLFTRTNVSPADGPQTAVVVDGTLTAERTYFWRVRADDGANASEFSGPAAFELVVPVVIDVPVPLSPVAGQTIPTNIPTMTVQNGNVSGRAGDVEYLFEIAADQAFTQHLSLRRANRGASGTTSLVGPSLTADRVFFWRVMGTNGTVSSPWSVPQAFRTPPAPAPPPPPPSPPPPPPSGGGSNVPGCVNGLLVDPRAYFFHAIGRSEGSSAAGWQQVLLNSGIPAGPMPGVRLPSTAPHFGITQQIRSTGEPAGRLFLPTDTPDGLGYYTHPINIVEADGSRWIWVDFSQGPRYTPRPCP